MPNLSGKAMLSARARSPIARAIRRPGSHMHNDTAVRAAIAVRGIALDAVERQRIATLYNDTFPGDGMTDRQIARLIFILTS